MANIADSFYQKTKVAVEEGRLDEALQAIRLQKSPINSKTRDLVSTLANALAHRADRHLSLDNEDAAWMDLTSAESLRSNLPRIEKLRSTLTKLMVSRAQNCLKEGDLRQCELVLGKLRDRNGNSSELSTLGTTCVMWIEGREFAETGEFQPAMASLERVRRRLIGSDTGVLRELETLSKKKNDFELLKPEFNDAVSKRDAPRIIELANRLLLIAPRDHTINRIRNAFLRGIEGNSKAVSGFEKPETPAVPESKTFDYSSFFLWIDGFAGYFVLLDDKVSIGHSGSENPVNLPWVADIGRVHASLVRQKECFVIEPHLPVAIDGQLVTQTSILDEDTCISLGETCKINFKLPHRGSLTALLYPSSNHRPPVPVDGIILLSQSLILWDNEASHIRVPGLDKKIVLYRTSQGINIKSEGVTVVDGKKLFVSALLGNNSLVISGAVTFSLEPAPARLGL
jgi:hypothetical protein